MDKYLQERIDSFINDDSVTIKNKKAYNYVVSFLFVKNCEIKFRSQSKHDRQPENERMLQLQRVRGAPDIL